MTVNPNAAYRIEEWEESHPHWEDVLALIAEQGQADWFTFSADWHLRSHLLVAHVDHRPVGFLRFVVQVIGLEDDHEPVTLHGQALIEAKILAFGVRGEYRRLGIGRALQQKAVQIAMERGCYQVRSFSGGNHSENHRLKLEMGFGIQPIVRDGDTRCAYYILPLRANAFAPANAFAVANVDEE